MTTIKIGKNKFEINDIAKKVDMSGLVGKNIKNLTNKEQKEQQDLLIVLAQLAGIGLSDGTLKGKVN